VDWKAYSRGRGLLLKEFDESSQTGLHFDFHRLHLLPLEERLEQLAKWVDLASQNGQPFSIALPDQKMGPSSGLVYAHRVWKELALVKSEENLTKERS
jgi:uncharacterized protein (DUF58 family)